MLWFSEVYERHRQQNYRLVYQFRRRHRCDQATSAGSVEKCTQYQQSQSEQHDVYKQHGKLQGGSDPCGERL